LRETVIVTGRNRHGGEVALTVRQPDGMLAQLPIWMTDDQAAAIMVTQIPRLSLACLRELCLELDAWQSLLRDDPRRKRRRACRVCSRDIANPTSSRPKTHRCR
jgi:hypothetical protein